MSAGDLIAEIETDKATMEVEAVDEGKVGKLLVEEGAEGVEVNAVIAVLVGDGEEAPADAGNLRLRRVQAGCRTAAAQRRVGARKPLASDAPHARDGCGEKPKLTRHQGANGP